MEVSIDFETRSLVDIKLGAWRYAEDPSTEILCFSWQHDGMSQPDLWVPGQELPPIGDSTIRAWNAEFELAIWTRILVPQFGAPPLKFTQIVDTQAEAMAMALPQSLGECGEALNLLDEHLKDPEGKRLIQYLCRPYKGKLREDPERLKRLYEYCKRDVIAERAIARKLRRLDARELLLYRRNLQMNYRGLEVDADRVRTMRGQYHALRDDAIDECKRLTGGISPRQTAKFTEHVGLPNLQKKTVERAIADNHPSTRLLQLRQIASSTSLAKLDKLPLAVCSDNRMRGLFRYHGAGPGRWVSQGGFNAQNLPRGNFETLEDYEGGLEKINHGRASVRDLVGCLRTVFAFPMSVVDYSQIETRMLLWLAGDTAGLDEFRQGLDPYITMASALYHVPYESVVKPQRQIGKSAVLGAGYQLGWRGYIAYADNMNIAVSEAEAVTIIDAFRTKYAKVTYAWAACQEAAVGAIRNPGEVYVAAKTQFVVKAGYLWLILPSGRRICYKSPWLTPGREEWMGPQINFWGRDRYTRKWSEQTTYGGSLFQSITQGSARDIMADAMLRMWDKGLDVRGTVHDEVICRGYVQAEMSAIMAKLPEWCADMPIAVDGWQGEFYRK